VTRVAALDISLNSSGFCDEAGPRLIKSTTTGVARLVEMENAILRACHADPLTFDQWGCSGTHCAGDEHADLVAIEGYAFGKGQGAHQLGELGGVVRVALHEMVFDWIEVPPVLVKQMACGTGAASKNAVLTAAARRLDYQGESNDEADSLWLYALVKKALGEDVVTVPATHAKAAKQVARIIDEMHMKDGKWRPVSPVVPSLSTTGHCCVCAVICHHIGPIQLCADHKTPPPSPGLGR